ncbi:hypothetical protein CR513_37023, partial [Mucuna pruriens]
MHWIPSELRSQACLGESSTMLGNLLGSARVALLFWVDLRSLIVQHLTGPIIPVLMHRIPSELRSQACLGDSSTRMGDLLGSPRVAPLFCTKRR